MYALLLAVTTSGPALGATIINRLAITLVELVLFGAGVAGWRRPAREEVLEADVGLTHSRLCSASDAAHLSRVRACFVGTATRGARPTHLLV